MEEFLAVRRGSAPLILSLPHTGTDLPTGLESRFRSAWRARKDTDWWIDRLYDFAADLDATMVRTSISRSVIDVNRDPSGAPLYPGQPTTALCPTETFDGEPLYRPGDEPDADEVARRRTLFFEPYHAALATEIARLVARHRRIVLYDCHSIRSRIPRLFEGELPHMNVGTYSGRSCGPGLQQSIEAICAASAFSWVANGRFTGGWITRRYGRPESGVHAVQMELACRGYLREPAGPADETNWPVDYDPGHAAPMRETLRSILQACMVFARTPEG